MKLRFRNIIAFIVICMALIFVVGCKDDKNGDKEKNEFIESNYQIGLTYEFKETIDLVKAKEELDKALKIFNEVKNYSYDQVVKGFSEEEYTLSGKTIIDVRSEMPKASMELSGSGLTYKFYVTDNKAYVDMNGDKTYTLVNKDLSDLVGDMQSVIGGFVSFDKEQLNETNLKQVGIDKFGATVIEFNVSDTATATIVIFEGKIMKVLYTNLDQMEYSALYNYDQVDVVLPSDLDTYIKK